ncbi:MAG TPA: hypothetical protein VGK19_06215 [Capsulimonadaceae bacterium]|jgi:serine O-acetyltransferase
MAEDVRGMVVDRGQGRLGYVVSATLKIALYPRIRAVLLFRIANAFYKRRLGILAYAIQAHILKISGAELHPAANIGPGFCLVHSNGVVIGDRATIGAHFICMHQVTVGDSGKGGGQPTIGEWVTASAGSKILGGITVGDQAVIGANSVVLADVPPKGVAVGSPARVVKIRE